MKSELLNGELIAWDIEMYNYVNKDGAYYNRSNPNLGVIMLHHSGYILANPVEGSTNGEMLYDRHSTNFW